MTDKRSLTSPANGRKSMGPITAMGKARSSRNATRHGLFSRELLLPGEVREEYDALLMALLSEHRPVGVLESTLVEQIAMAIWRQRRWVRAENAQIQQSQIQAIREDCLQEVRSAQTIQALLAELRQLSVNPEVESWPLGQFQELFPLAWELLTQARESVDPELLFGARSVFIGELYPGVAAFAAKQYSVWQARLGEVLRRDAMSVLCDSGPLSRYKAIFDNDLYKAIRALRQTQAAREKVIDVDPAG